MNNEKLKKIALENIPQDEEIIGIFKGNSSLPWTWFFLVGPIVFLGIRTYIVVVTDLHIYFNRLDPYIDVIESNDVFEYNEIKKLKFKKHGATQNLFIDFNNDRSIKLQTVMPKKKPKKNKLQLTREVFDFLKTKEEYRI